VRYKFPQHEDGETRTRRAFLLLPRTIGGELRWLERAVWIEVYSPNWGSMQDWKPVRWWGRGR
jgi:hypothetical protein